MFTVLGMQWDAHWLLTLTAVVALAGYGWCRAAHVRRWWKLLWFVGPPAFLFCCLVSRVPETYPYYGGRCDVIGCGRPSVKSTRPSGKEAGGYFVGDNIVFCERHSPHGIDDFGYMGVFFGSGLALIIWLPIAAVPTALLGRLVKRPNKCPKCNNESDDFLVSCKCKNCRYHRGTDDSRHRWGEPRFDVCIRCFGHGEIVNLTGEYNPGKEVCPKCLGKGKLPSFYCQVCGTKRLAVNLR